MSVKMSALDRALRANKVEEAERQWSQLPAEERAELGPIISDNLGQAGGKMTVPMAQWLVDHGVSSQGILEVPGEGFRDWLSAAISADNAELVRWLVTTQDVSPNRALPSNGPLPLMEALRDEHWAVADLLLELGGDLAAVNWHGQTALHIAAAGHKVQAMVWLVAHGADPAIVDNHNHVAAELIPTHLDSTTWCADATYQWLSECEEATADARKSIPSYMQDEALVEKIGLKFQAVAPQARTAEDHRVEQVLIERGVIEPSQPPSSRQRRTP